MEAIMYFVKIALIVTVVSVIVGFLVLKFGFPSWDDVKHLYETKGKGKGKSKSKDKGKKKRKKRSK